MVPHLHRHRPWLQRRLAAIERWRAETLTIRAGDPLAAEFAEFGKGSWIKWPRICNAHPSSIAIGSKVEIQTHVCFETYAPPGQVVLRFGDLVQVGHYARFVALNGIYIGEDCGIGHGVTLGDSYHDWETASEGQSPGRMPLRTGAPMRIEDGAWIGNSSTVMGGITVGARAIVGPHSVVTRDVPPETMVSGIPARRVPNPTLDRRQ